MSSRSRNPCFRRCGSQVCMSLIEESSHGPKSRKRGLSEEIFFFFFSACVGCRGDLCRRYRFVHRVIFRVSCRLHKFVNDHLGKERESMSYFSSNSFAESLPSCPRGTRAEPLKLNISTCGLLVHKLKCPTWISIKRVSDNVPEPP